MKKITAVERQKIKAALLTKIYEPYDKQYDAELALIVTEHSRLIGTPQAGFLYKGSYYGNTAARGNIAKPLVKSLTLRMEELLNGFRELTAERSYVTSYINAILCASNCVSTYLSILPYSVHDVLRRFDKDAVSEPMDSARLEHIMQFNQKGADLLKKRLLKTIVLA